MSAPIDVLAVLDVAAYMTAHTSFEVSHQVLEARDAVAELVEAVSAVYGEPCFSEGQAADDPCSPDCMSCRIRAALAKFGGAA